MFVFKETLLKIKSDFWKKSTIPLINTSLVNFQRFKLYLNQSSGNNVRIDCNRVRIFWGGSNPQRFAFFNYRFLLIAQKGNRYQGLQKKTSIFYSFGTLFIPTVLKSSLNYKHSFTFIKLTNLFLAKSATRKKIIWKLFLISIIFCFVLIKSKCILLPFVNSDLHGVRYDG